MYSDLSVASLAIMWIIGAYRVHKLQLTCNFRASPLATIGSSEVSSATLDRMCTQAGQDIPHNPTVLLQNVHILQQPPLTIKLWACHKYCCRLM